VTPKLMTFQLGTVHFLPPEQQGIYSEYQKKSSHGEGHSLFQKMEQLFKSVLL